MPRYAPSTPSWSSSGNAGADTNSVPVYWLFPLVLAGAVTLAVALWRSGVVPAWAALCIGLGALLHLAPEIGVGAVAVVFAAVRVVGSIPVARALLAGRTER